MPATTTGGLANSQPDRLGLGPNQPPRTHVWCRTQRASANVDDLASRSENVSERTCHGRFGECLLTGRLGVFNSTGAVVHIIDSMFDKYATRRGLDLVAGRQAEVARGWIRAASR